MCLSIPGKVISITDKGVIVECFGKSKAMQSTIEVKPGDYVTLDNEIIINKLSEKEAKRIMMMLENQTPEQYFFKYAFPALATCSTISQEQRQELENIAKKGQSPSKEELEKLFSKAFARMMKLEQKTKKPFWYIESIKEYWLKEHNRIIDSKEDGYNIYPEEFCELCKVKIGKVLVSKKEGDKFMLKIKLPYSEKTIESFFNAEKDQYISFHWNHACEIISKEDFEEYGKN